MARYFKYQRKNVLENAKCRSLVMTLGKAARITRCSLARNKPYHVQWLITRKCNYKCRGCNVWREQDPNELTTEEVKKGLDILRDLGVIEIVFSGGNPLLREDMGEILEYASKSFITTVYDNGSIAARRIEDLRSADFVAISVDTLDPEKGDYLKGIKGSLATSLEAVEKLHEAGIPVSISPTISQLNLYEVLDTTRHFLKRGIPVWYCLYSYDNDEAGQSFRIGKKSDEFAITDQKAAADLFDTFIKMKKTYKNLLVTTQLLKATRDTCTSAKRTWKCRALSNFFVVDHMGRIAGCHLRTPITSIFNLKKLWNTSEFDKLRSEYSTCERCTYTCYVFYSLHGSIIGNLQVAKDRWKSAGLLIKKNRSKLPSSVTLQ